MAWRADESQRAFIEKKLEELKRRKEGGSFLPEEKPVVPEKKPRPASKNKVKASAFDASSASRSDASKPRTSFEGILGGTGDGSIPVQPPPTVPEPTTMATPSSASQAATSSQVSNDSLPSLTNVFKNDGSFLEQFKKMQKLKIEVRSKQEPQLETTDAQRKLEEETAGELTARDMVAEPRRQQIERLAISVVVNGPSCETQAKAGKDMKFLTEQTGNEWEFYQERLTALSAAKDRAEQSGALPMVREEVDREARRQKRKTRWGDWGPEQNRDLPLMAYAQQVYGSTDLTPDQWKQLEDQRKMRAIFEMMQAKKAHLAKLQAAGKVKYEYDSDEDDEGGTWEHKRRALEMEKTREQAKKLTQNARGKHHMGDFLPTEELEQFMKRYEALKNGQSLNLNAYEENKLKEDNVGFQMLQKMGWNEGSGLGAQGAGITTPVAAQGNTEQRGLGQAKPGDLNAEDDEYEAYRKRMMLAYRFRPNPLNNPRRQYY
ncbi:SURP and G-patch domain-containing protein 1-like [Varroa jacobsoni]|nr:SURP and G-patch domain-containing protein 1-like isoform X2 [Varroa destructor]XP_022673396.1 SURP and G-patch domain-containing protein 1-like isoform X2 [Varroa destructor]XP_022673397.1 SURP and G-patch domain-containing protein 1-like isoform X2 [Varroa destructor]XP_022673398.1 SURP and G-patch domain-containing protein 1-like isoform X2 [Varroa destructor]XP_022673399.1 SURP and G-patch domain-containing protein 1-like isoform X2 [Varroa destructor]XP_022700179.1 SURP and G-patch dom